MKKIFVSMFLTVTIVLFSEGIKNVAEAREVYIGTFGLSDVYLYTQSVNIRSRRPLTFSCKTHWIGTRNKNVNEYHNLNFFSRNGFIYASTDGSSAYDVDKYAWSQAVYRYVRNNW